MPLTPAPTPAPLRDRLGQWIEPAIERFFNGIQTWAESHDVEATLLRSHRRIKRAAFSIALRQWCDTPGFTRPASGHGGARWEQARRLPDESTQAWIDRYAAAIAAGLSDRPPAAVSRSSRAWSCLLLAPWIALCAFAWRVDHAYNQSSYQYRKGRNIADRPPAPTPWLAHAPHPRGGRAARIARWARHCVDVPVAGTAWMRSTDLRARAHHPIPISSTIASLLWIAPRSICLWAWASARAALWPWAAAAQDRRERKEAREAAGEARRWAARGGDSEGCLDLDLEAELPPFHSAWASICARPSEWTEACLALCSRAASALDPWQRSMAAIVLLDGMRQEAGARGIHIFPNQGALSMGDIFARAARGGAWLPDHSWGPPLARSIMASPHWRQMRARLGASAADTVAVLAHGGAISHAWIAAMESADPLSSLDWLLDPDRIDAAAEPVFAQGAAGALGRHPGWTPERLAEAHALWAGADERHAPSVALTQARQAFHASVERSALSTSLGASFEDKSSRPARRSSRI